MPYKLIKKGDRYCVQNTDTGENKGCSDTRKMAVAHMRKLYMLENETQKDAMTSSDIEGMIVKAAAQFTLETGESFEDDDLSVDKDYYDSVVPVVCTPPLYGATSFAEVEAQDEAYKKTMKIEDLIWKLGPLARNVMANPEIEDKGAAIENLAEELANRIDAIGAVDEDDSEDDDEELDAGNGEESQESKEAGMENPVEKGEEASSQKARTDVSEADKKRAVREYGNVKFADPVNKKYPLDTKAHVRAALAYINMPRNARKYSASQLATIKNRIKAAAKKYGIEVSEKTALGKAIDAVKSIFDKPDQDIMFWKERDGSWMWMARYSNNFIDDDNPPDIISERSHRRFVEMVDKGVYPYPELWLWHNKEWNIGKAVWCAYDDSGFAIAAGYSNPGCEPVFEKLSKLKDVGLSHGMPIASIQRDPTDNRVIVEHQTKEISVLPLYAAANMLTSFFVLKEEEATMPIPKEKKAEALEKWGLSATLLDQLETLNKATAKQAVKDGLENKDKDVETDTTIAENAPDTTVDNAEAQAKTEDAEEDQGRADESELSDEVLNESPSRKELADALAPYFQKMYQTFEAVEKLNAEIAALKELRAQDKVLAEKAKAEENLVRMSPTAALLGMFGKSAIGDQSTRVKEDDELVNSKPKEAEVQPITGIQFIDAMLSQSNGGSR